MNSIIECDKILQIHSSSDKEDNRVKMVKSEREIGLFELYFHRKDRTFVRLDN